MYALMITPNKFPEGDAGAVRDGYFAKIYQALGYKVFHIGMGTDSKKGVYKDVSYVSLYRENGSLFSKVKNNLSYRVSLEQIYEKIVSKQGVPNLIHIYDIPASGIEWARRIAIKNEIQIVHDSVEWYSACEFKFGKLAYPYILKNTTNTKLIKSPIDVIAISSYLEKHFTSKGLRTIRIPVIMDSDEYEPKERVEISKIKIVYAGSPAKKDFLAECIQAFEELPEDVRRKFEFRILGADQLFVQQCCSGIIPEEIMAFGRVPRAEVISNLEEADFSILIRPENERYTKAGFPTKFVEAMMNGCAMICNLTSDLEMYLEDGVNSVIVKGSTVEAIKDALFQVSSMSHDQLNRMRECSRKTAENNFDYRLFVEKMRTFLC